MRQHILLVCAIAGLYLLAAEAHAAQDTFRWRDDQGQVHYSNLLPQTAIEHGYEVLNDNGVVVKVVPPPLTAAQRAAAVAEAKRLEREAAARAARVRHDNMLLQTFDSVQAIESLRDERVGALDGQLRLLQDRQRRLEKRLAELKAIKAKAEAEKRPVPPYVDDESNSVNAELQNVDATMQGLSGERAQTKRRFDADIVRFKQLQAEGRVPQ